MSTPFLLKFDPNEHAVLDPNREHLPYKFPKKLLYAFVEKENIDNFLKEYPHQELGKFDSVSFKPTIYELDMNQQKIALCQAPVGAPAATQLLDWLIAYGVKEVLAIGSAGSLVSFPENQFFLVEKALRDEGTSMHYLPAQNFINLDPKFINKIASVTEKLPVDIQKVTTWTTDGFFRETADKVLLAKKMGCQLVEMESAALAACAQFRNIKFGQILFSADSLANVEQHDDRNWGHGSRKAAVELGIQILSEI